MSTFFLDLKYAFRQLGKNPGFSVVVILILALGIGINATAFTFVNAILFRPLQVREPGQLFSLSIHTQDEVFDGRFSYPDLEFLQANARAFEGVFTFKQYSLRWQYQPNQTRSIQTEWVSRDYFKTLGVHICLGRAFREEELSVPNAYPVAILSHAFWHSQFEGRPDVLGTDMIVNGVNYTVVGVAEAGFEGMRPSNSPAVWLPLMMFGRVSGGALTDVTQYEVVGRVPADSSARSVETQLSSLLPELEKNFTKFKGKRAQGKVKLRACGYGSLASSERYPVHRQDSGNLHGVPLDATQRRHAEVHRRLALWRHAGAGVVQQASDLAPAQRVHPLLDRHARPRAFRRPH